MSNSVSSQSMIWRKIQHLYLKLLLIVPLLFYSPRLSDDSFHQHDDVHVKTKEEYWEQM